MSVESDLKAYREAVTKEAVKAEYDERLQRAGFAMDLDEPTVAEWVSEDTYRLSGPIDDMWGVNSEKVIADWRAKEEFTLELRSPGGQLDAGLALCAYLDASGKKVRAIAEGIVASAAAFLFLRAPERVMVASSSLMLHGPQGRFPLKGNLKQMQASFKLIESAMEATGKLIQSIVKPLSAEAADGLLETDVWFTAEEALESGLHPMDTWE